MIGNEPATLTFDPTCTSSPSRSIDQLAESAAEPPIRTAERETYRESPIDGSTLLVACANPYPGFRLRRRLVLCQDDRALGKDAKPQRVRGEQEITEEIKRRAIRTVRPRRDRPAVGSGSHAAHEQLEIPARDGFRSNRLVRGTRLVRGNPEKERRFRSIGRALRSLQTLPDAFPEVCVTDKSSVLGRRRHILGTANDSEKRRIRVRHQRGEDGGARYDCVSGPGDVAGRKDREPAVSSRSKELERQHRCVQQENARGTKEGPTS